MADYLFGVIELTLVFGGAIAWGLWELRATHRARRESERRESEAPRIDPGVALPRE